MLSVVRGREGGREGGRGEESDVVLFRNYYSSAACYVINLNCADWVVEQQFWKYIPLLLLRSAEISEGVTQ